MQEIFENIKKNIVRKKLASLNCACPEVEEAITEYDPSAFLNGFSFGMDTALKVVDSMKQNNGWIFCNENLPEERGWCLAVFKEPDTDFVLVPRVAEYLLGLRTSGTTEEGWIILNCTDKNDACEYYKKLKCVAWQPIPALPKKEV